MQHKCSKTIWMSEMAIVVKKFGGTSVGSIELIRSIAHKIAITHQEGESLVLVVSAMAKTTDELMRLAFEISAHPSRRELDMLLTAGERISMSLLSLALHNEGYSSISFTGSQSGILTDAMHGNARITDVNAFRIREELGKGKIVIVAGFQGVSPAKEITTLGRGGSDTSAVALASYLKADKCEIFTDVDGVYTADPRLVANARLIPEIDYELMLALAYSGSKVLHPRAVEFAYKYNIPVEIKSSFSFAPGTMMRSASNMENRKTFMEDKKITAIAHKDGLIRYQFNLEPKLIESLKKWNNEIFRYRFVEGVLELVIESKYENEIDHLMVSQGFDLYDKSSVWASISLVGLGINLDPVFLADLLDLLNEFHIESISHSDKTIDLLINSDNLVECLNLLHKTYIEESK